MKYLLFRLTAYLKNKGLIHKSYIVGGAVRDILFRREIKDLDLVIDADIEDIVKDFAYAINASLVCLDKEMLIFRIVKNKHWVDISRLRCGSLYIDLFERDLTINAMAIPLANFQQFESHLIDPFGGYDDLLAGVIRMIREENFLKDPLRILRVFRFSATLGFNIESNTLNTVSRLGHYIKEVARERLYEEFVMIVRCQNSADLIRMMQEKRILTHIFSLPFTDNAIKRYCKIENLINNINSCFSGYTDVIEKYIKDNINLFCVKFFTLFEDKRDVIQSGLSLKMSKKEIEKLNTFTNYQGKFYQGFKNKEDVQSEYIIKLLYELGDDIYGLILLDTVIDENEDNDFFRYVEQVILFYNTLYCDRLKKIPLLTGQDIREIFNIKPSATFKKIINYVNIMTLLGKVTNKQEAIELVSLNNWLFSDTPC